MARNQAILLIMNYGSCLSTVDGQCCRFMIVLNNNNEFTVLLEVWSLKDEWHLISVDAQAQLQTTSHR